MVTLSLVEIVWGGGVGALILANDEALTLRALSQGTGQLHRDDVRLAILSACETQFPGLSLPDEVISLAAGML